MTAAPSSIRAFVASAPSVPSELRYQIEPAVLAAAAIHGGAVVRTCHRIEWYHAAGGDPVAMVAAAGAGIPPGAFALGGSDAVERLISLALGLESVVLGEDQILHQLRVSVGDSRRRGHFGGELALAFDLALHAGRAGRTWRPTRPASVADLAVARAEALGGPMAGRRVLVVGSGEMGRLAVGAARLRGADVVMTSRDRGRADEAAARLGVRSWPFDPGDALASAALVIVALAGPWTLEQGSLRALALGPVVVDLSMPAALAESTVASLGERHVGIDDLASSAAGATGDAPSPDGEDPAMRRYRERLIGLRERTLATFRERVATRNAAATARQLAERIEDERRDVLDALARGRPNLGTADLAAIDAMTLRLTERLFAAALDRLAHDGDGRGGRAVREVFGL